MKELEIDVFISGKKTRFDLGTMDIDSLYRLSMKLRQLLRDNEFILSHIRDADLWELKGELGSRTINILYKNGISTVAGLLATSYNDIEMMEGMGRKSLGEIRILLTEIGKMEAGR
ncbi:DNA-directed RNA polymerase subunit alpha C-terminal domain-containing protein [Sphingobacterium multivorum]|uniref:DNA-directed RNA polymerase subunit alpha C-terminal domain-containing protein n=1 Tax=Sphingobacterium multivorum TaxID=28454 RepID=UPI0028AB7C26|nr:DNA-directed RNA polymerase subunit alpha C-terminal domain-containing protein [Sphingobacterium multivorum]